MTIYFGSEKKNSIGWNGVGEFYLTKSYKGQHEDKNKMDLCRSHSVYDVGFPAKEVKIFYLKQAKLVICYSFRGVFTILS